MNLLEVLSCYFLSYLVTMLSDYHVTGIKTLALLPGENFYFHVEKILSFVTHLGSSHRSSENVLFERLVFDPSSTLVLSHIILTYLA